MIKYSAENRKSKKSLRNEFQTAKNLFLKYALKAKIIEESEIELVKKHLNYIQVVSVENEGFIDNNNSMRLSINDNIRMQINKNGNFTTNEEKLFAYWHEFIHILQIYKKDKYISSCFSNDLYSDIWIFEIGAQLGEIFMMHAYFMDNIKKADIILANENDLQRKFGKNLNYFALIYNNTFSAGYPNLQTVGLNYCAALEMSPVDLIKLTLFPEIPQRATHFIKVINKTPGIDFEEFTNRCQDLLKYDLMTNFELEKNRKAYENTYDIIDKKMKEIANYYKSLNNNEEENIIC